jgi:addiction module HigA family antidote
MGGDAFTGKLTSPVRIVSNVKLYPWLVENYVEKPLGISAYRLLKDIGIPQTSISAILKGNRRITADIALRLTIYFCNSAKFWLGLQDEYDLE